VDQPGIWVVPRRSGRLPLLLGRSALPRLATISAIAASVRNRALGWITARHHRPAIKQRSLRESDTIPSWEAAPFGVTMSDVSTANFSVVVYREDDAWEAELLPAALTENLDGLIHALRQQPSIGGTIGLAAVGDDFFVALRVIGSQVSVFLSDVTASVDWPLARQVLEYLDIPIPDDDNLDQVLPAGDLSIFADLGIDEMELGALSGDLDMFPYEVLESIARRLGFGQALERALDGALRP
jgi:putative tRNA adenosine deaminase-associated protein